MTEAQRRDYAALLEGLPTAAPVFLPTQRVAPEDRIEGVRAVRALYESELDAVHRPRLRALRARHKGQRRCVVIGNGPSLNRTDLSVLRDEVTFATNGFFLKAAELDWTPTYYVVEDHLVAEDRRAEIAAFKGPTKLFPAYLRYCVAPSQDVVFFDHRARPSSPHGFDFSENAEAVSYACGTVTYACLQLAWYFGFVEIVLVGVDADYAIPGDAQRTAPDGLGVLDMASDDPNHFHPDYYGKGYRWRDPNVERMLGAYAEAKRIAELRGRRIINATAGGKLEVFDRASLEDALAASGGEPIERPKVLLIDHSGIGDGSATGERKAALFAGWPRDRLMRVWDAGDGAVRLGANGTAETAERNETGGWETALARAAAFAPDLIVYRPTPGMAHLHEAAMALIGSLDAPVVPWIVDDWPSTSPPGGDGDALVADFTRLVAQAPLRLSIGEAMSDALKARYGAAFRAVSNGVDPAEWTSPIAHDAGPVLVRYAGALSAKTTRDSVLDVARAVEALGEDGVDVRFEIRTSPHWAEAVADALERLTRTQVFTETLAAAEHRAWLSDADIALIAYNFDAESQRYTRLSVAAKLPECLASGAALLAVGPLEIATMARLEEIGCGERVTEPGPAPAAAALRRLVDDPARRRALAIHARAAAFEQFDLRTTRARLEGALIEAANARQGEMAGHPRDDHAHVGETEIVAWLLRERHGEEHVMVDVGAHVGSAADAFHALGWRIHCFEPDPKNRAALQMRFGGVKAVSIDPRALSDAPATGVQFFASPESTGVSALHAFTDSHEEAARVDVTTLALYAEEAGLDRIDFLKIDVEGFDLSVLKGAPWDRISPDVIECEFEDAKTLPLGHSWRDIADFLTGRGYSVYLSEWHPIRRYGARHDWRRVVRHPIDALPETAWGNMLAFRIDPGAQAVRDAFERAVVLHEAASIGAPPAGAFSAGWFGAERRETPPWHAPAAQRLLDVSPTLFMALRAAKRALWPRRTPR